MCAILISVDPILFIEPFNTWHGGLRKEGKKSCLMLKKNTGVGLSKLTHSILQFVEHLKQAQLGAIFITPRRNYRADWMVVMPRKSHRTFGPGWQVRQLVAFLSDPSISEMETPSGEE